MFDKIKKSTIDKLSGGITKREEETEIIAETIIEPVDDNSETILVDEHFSVQTSDDYLYADDSEENFQGLNDDDDISAWDTIVDEIKTRSKENNELKTLIEGEKQRLKNERIAAKNRNVFRKLQIVDNYISKKEETRDEQALQDFKNVKEKELSAVRSKRGKELAKKNKKTIAGLIGGLLVAGCAAGGISVASSNISMATSYDQAVAFILAEDFDAARNELKDNNHNDAEALYSYSTIQSDIDYYKGTPGDMYEALEDVEGIENIEVKNQYNEACDEIKKASEVQKEVDAIEIASVEDVSKVKDKKIDESVSNVKERYRTLINTENLDKANNIVYALENDTKAGQLITRIDKLGDITLESEKELNEIRGAYDGLNEEEKTIAFNYNAFTKAEEKYATLKAEQDKKIAEEEARKKAEEEERKKKEKEATLQAEAEAYAAKARDSSVVWVTGTGKYHVDGCPYVHSYEESTYGQVKNRCSPCRHCNPDVYIEKSYENYISAYIRDHSDD